MSSLGPVEQAELVTAAVAEFQGRHPDVTVARVDVVDLKEIEARGLICDRCGATIAVAFFLKLCDDCIDQIKGRL